MSFKYQDPDPCGQREGNPGVCMEGIGDREGFMKFKKIRFFSGLLTVTAAAAMTGTTVIAGETEAGASSVQDVFLDSDEILQEGELQSDSVDGFLGSGAAALDSAAARKEAAEELQEVSGGTVEEVSTEEKADAFDSEEADNAAGTSRESDGAGASAGSVNASEPAEDGRASGSPQDSVVIPEVIPEVDAGEGFDVSAAVDSEEQEGQGSEEISEDGIGDSLDEIPEGGIGDSSEEMPALIREAFPVEPSPASGQEGGDAADQRPASDAQPASEAPAQEGVDAVSEDALQEAVDAYNEAVLPKLKVSLEKGNVYTGILERHLPEQDDAQTLEVPYECLPSISTAPTQTAAAAMEVPEAAQKKLVIASPNVYLNIHESPTLSSGVVGKMYSNDVAIELRREDDRWTRIRSGNVVGYVMNDYLIEGSEAQALSEIVGTTVATVDAEDDAEVHQEANDVSKIVTSASGGEQYEVMDSEDGWLGILTEDGEGYIPSSEVTLSMAFPVAESSRQEADRVSKSNVKERADYEQRKADKAGAVVDLARIRAGIAGIEDEETATSVVNVALRAADAAAAQADVARVAVSQAGAESGQAVIEFAKRFLGNPYVWGGSSLTHGADCSGFTMAIYANFGFRLPHFDVYQRSVGSPVSSLAEARAGDIVCYNGHVALYMGDGMIIHAQDERHGITTSRANFMNIVCIRRLFD